MTYEEVRRYLSQAAHARGIRPGLARMRQLMELLGNPEKRLTGIIHVAGTNGKGSILAFLDEILRRSGYHVVKYTSPAVFSYLERYTADGRQVSREQFTAAAERVIAGAEFMSDRDGDPPTVFEMETAIAYLLAADAACDFFLLETGMGGLLDATNIEERAALSIIASVSMDHMAFLGNTLEEIAAQKAGIIKDGCPVVVSASNFSRKSDRQEDRLAVEKTMRREAKTQQTGSRKTKLQEEARLETTPESAAAVIERVAAEHGAVLYRGDDSVPYPVSLAGTFQQENAGTVFTAVRVLRELGYDIPESCVREGFAHTVWPGRLEMIRRDPLCVLDGAHNAAAAKLLAETLREPCFAKRQKFLVLSVFKDKEYDKVVRALAPLAEKVYVFSLNSPRGLPADTLAACVRKYTERPVSVCENARSAVLDAYSAAEKAGPEAMVLCCGSLSYLGEAKHILLSAAEERSANRP